nr:hypothetical protein [Tanacetum cinerariifolium]GFA47027.1 hypothetical protein [Tanacetum cinerariifolium]
MRLQALIDRKKVIIMKATIRETLRLDDAESIDCLPNEEIFIELSRMGAQVGDLSSHITKYSSPALTQKQADDVADEGVAGVDVDALPATANEPSIPLPTPPTQPPPPSQELPSTSQVISTPPPSLIAKPSSPPQQQQPSQPTHDAEISLDLLHTLMETCTTLTRKVEALEQDKVALALEIIKLKQRVKKLERKNKLKVYGLKRLRKGEIIANIDIDEDVFLKDVNAVKKTTEIEENVLIMQDDELEPSELKEVVEVVTTAKLMTEVVTAAAATITAASTPITAATITAAPSGAGRRKGVVIRDQEETTTPSIIIYSKPKSTDKGKEIMVQEPKPVKKKTQIEHDEVYARKLEYFNSNLAFLEKTKEHMEEEDSRALKRTSESLEKKVVKKQKLDEEVEELRNIYK